MNSTTNPIAPPTLRIRQIERRSRIDLEQFVEHYAEPGIPVVIEGNFADWAGRIGFDELQQRFADRQVQAVRMVDSMPREERLSVSELLASVLSGHRELHMRGDGFMADFPELSNRLDCTPLRRMLRRRNVKYLMWISPEGKRSTLHHDTCLNNLNVQIVGRKKFRLMPPDSYRKIQPFGYTWSPIDPFEPDLNRYPSFAQVDVFETVLSAGETIFIPKYWWHGVEAQEASLNVNIFAVHRGIGACWRTLRGLPLGARAVLMSSLVEARLPEHSLHWLMTKTLYRFAMRRRASARR